MFKNVIYRLFLLTVIYVTGCSSGPYELEETTVEYEEKTIVADTIKTVSEIKEETSAFEFIVQIGAFINRSYFENFYGRARSELGNEVYYDFKNNLYRIKLGKFRSKSDALQLLERVKSMGYNDAFILSVRIK